jgi:hypothetical protein
VIPATVEKRHVSVNIVCGATNTTRQLINSETTCYSEIITEITIFLLAYVGSQRPPMMLNSWTNMEHF